MSDKYASLSPYTYCADNPVKLVDPNGEEVWIPGLDAKGNVTYTAEKDDDYYTFKRQFECTKETASAIFAKSGLSTSVGGVKAGSVIEGKDVYAVTKKSQILRANWQTMDNNHRITSVMFAIQYANYHNEKNSDKNGDSSVDLSRFISFLPPFSIFRYQKDMNRILLPNEESIPIHFMEIDIDKLGNPPTIQHYPENGGYYYKDKDGQSYVRYRYLSGANPKAGSRFTGILLSVPSKYQGIFDSLYN